MIVLTISKETPLNDITLRRYEKPSSHDRELVRKLCLSLGLLQPADSRDVIVDVFTVLLKARKQKKLLSSEEITIQVAQLRKKQKLKMLGIASSNIRRQLRRLKDLMLIEKMPNGYRITEFMPLVEIFNEKTERFLLESILMRIKEYLAKVDEEF